MNQEDLVEEFNMKKRSSMVLRNGHSRIGFLFWQKEEAPRKACLNPNSSRHISCFRAIQGQSGDYAVDLDLVFSHRGIVHSRHKCCISCLSSVSSVKKYCPISTIFKPASEHSLDSFWSWDNCSKLRS